MPEDAETDALAEPSDGEAVVSVEHIGGIDRCEVAFSTGVTVLVGRNATNRTSFLTAVADVLGGAAATPKSDADEAAIRLRLDGETCSREYVREDGTLRSTGTPYTEQGDLVDLFVRLLEDNQVRRAVERNDDLRDLLMRPVDTAQIEERIRRLRRERGRLDTGRGLSGPTVGKGSDFRARWRRGARGSGSPEMSREQPRSHAGPWRFHTVPGHRVRDLR